MTVTNSDNNQIKKDNIYEEFILWSALPPSERAKSGIETQEQFADHYKIGVNTPTAWKKKYGFEDRVKLIRREWAASKTGGVIESIYNSAMNGNAQSQKMWLEHFEKDTRKDSENGQHIPVIHPEDILFIIQSMPEPYRAKHVLFLQEFLNDAQKLRYSGHLEDKEIPPQDHEVDAGRA